MQPRTYPKAMLKITAALALLPAASALREKAQVNGIDKVDRGRAVQIDANDGSYVNINYAGYMSYTDVTSHAGIDEDQEDIEDCYDTYSGDTTDADMFTCAWDVYKNGGADNPSSSRTIRGFSLQAEAKMAPLTGSFPNFTVFDQFIDYYGNYTYGDNFVTDAVYGRGVWKDLSFDNGDSVTDARWQAVKKGTAYINVPMYAMYEYFRRAHQTNNAVKRAAMTANDKVYKAVHGWDEGWAFWAGAKARPLSDGVISSSNGKLLFNLAEKRDAYFSTDTADSPSGALSWVNYKILAGSQVGRDMLSNFTTGLNAEYTLKAYKCIEKQAFIPMLQGCLQYGYKSDYTTNGVGDGKSFGEFYTFCAAAIPIVHAASSSVATTIMDMATPSSSGIEGVSYTTLRDALYPVLNDMGYKCSDIGVYSDDESFADSFIYNTYCNDDEVVDYCGMAIPVDEYDSDNCTTTITTSSSGDDDDDDDKDDKDGSAAMMGVGVGLLLVGFGFSVFGIYKTGQAVMGSKVPQTEMSQV